MEEYFIGYGDRIIEFKVLRKNVKNINLSVKPDMTVIVSVNEKATIDYIKKFVKSKARWIIRNISLFNEVQSKNISEKMYLSGETFKYLGKQYRLKVKESEVVEGVKYYQGYIYLILKDKNDLKRKKKLINDWYRDKAKEKFTDSLAWIYPIVKKYGILEPEIRIRNMTTRWGSCIKDKNAILLNLELIKAPKFCIDYVVLHELTHFKYGNHSNDFYVFMTSLMPDWKERKDILDEEVVRDL